MVNSLDSTVLLFSYGTLQNTNVQIANFGRELKGNPDSILGYKKSMVEITDENVIALSGQKFHPIVQPSLKHDDEVTGTVFQITMEELLAADQYEVEDYKRVLAPLKSGHHAWVYVLAS